MDQQAETSNIEKPESSISSDVKGKDAKVREEEERKQHPLLPKSAILRLLAELVRSYGGCAQLVAQHTYRAGQTELIMEVR